MAGLLSNEEIEERLSGSSWERDGAQIVRNWQFANFAQAIEFVNRVAAAAQEANHHPDILLHGWNKVRLVVTNHSAGGLTAADFALARTIDGLV